MLQGGEIIIILLVALVVLGPQRLPEVARKIGQWSAELRQAARELRSGLEKEVAELSLAKSAGSSGSGPSRRRVPPLPTLSPTWTPSKETGRRIPRPTTLSR